MAFTWASKDPDEIYPYQHDWAARLLLGAVSIGDSVVPIDDADVAKRPTLTVEVGDCTVTSIVNVPDSAKIQYKIEGGTNGVRCELIGTIFTAQGNKYQERFILPIVSK